MQPAAVSLPQMYIHGERKPQTRAVGIEPKRTDEKEHSTPLFLTSSFTYDSAADMAAAFADDSLDVNIYPFFQSCDGFLSRLHMKALRWSGNRTECAYVFATFMTFLSKGDHIISASAVFGSTHTILTKYMPKWGIEYSYFNMSNPGQITDLIRPNTKMLYVETPSESGSGYH